jgi:hypothetical protein
MGVEKSRGELFSLDVHRDSPQKAKIQVIEQKDNALWKRTVAVGFFDVSLSNLTSPAGDMPAKNSFIIVTVNNPAEVYAMSLSTNQTKPRKILSYGEKQDMVASMMEQSPFEVIPADIIFSNNNEYILFGNSRNENWRIYYTPVVKDSPDFNPKHYNPTLFVSP